MKKLKNMGHIKIKTGAVLLIALLVSIKSYPQYTKNFIQETTYLDSTGAKTMVAIAYKDGLGRPEQVIQVAASPGGKDIVQHIAYDAFGREVKKYLPYVATQAGGTYRPNAETEIMDFYNESINPKATTKISTDNRPWADISYESSPLNRLLEQGAPGEGWMIKGDNTGNTMRFSYGSNDSLEVILFKVNEDGQLVREAYHKKGSLTKTSVRDENGVWNTEYTDNMGQVVMMEVDTAGLKLQTYKVYNDFGLLCYTLPPKAIELLGATTVFNTNHPIIADLCYYYQYDKRKRTILKKIPGAAPIYMLYDKRDRMVLSQDGNMRDGSKWMFTKYDWINRPIQTGIYSDSRSIFDIRVLCDTLSIFYESMDITQEHAYSNNTFPKENTEILTVAYYDNYDFDTENKYSYSANNGFGQNLNSAVKGQITASKVRVLGSDVFLTTVNFYDKKYQVIQSIAENYLGGKDILSSLYDFAGMVLKTKQVHYKDGNAATQPIIINQRYAYDHAGRLDSVFHEIGGDDEVCMAVMDYNEIGELVKKNLHSKAGSAFLQEIDYKYNIRGWLTGVNDPDNLQLTGQPKDLFAMELVYNKPLFGINNKPQQNGNISASRWIDSKYNQMSAYIFDYDNVNRLVKGDYLKYNTVWVNTADFDLDTVSYDANGNILNLKRYRESGVLMDNMLYAYYNNGTSNQLITVTDNGEKTAGFRDIENAIDYTYDANGNMVKDRNKGLDSIVYNLLNLPSDIIGGNDTISYFYTATGVKIAQMDKDGTVRQYIGNIIYFNDTLDYILTPEGMVKVTNSNFIYSYHIKDHLGNTRVSFTDSSGIAVVTQVADYYPFGLRINYSNPRINSDNKYLYNGKEMQDCKINNSELGWYDYSARYYMPDLGRFAVMDPAAEMYFSWTPYNYVGNNPIRRTDPTGMIWADSTAAKRLQNSAQNRINQYEKTNKKLDEKAEKAWRKGKNNKAARLMGRINSNKEAVSELQESITQIEEMGTNQNFTFEFKKVNGEKNHHVTKAANGNIQIEYSSTDIQLHETRHAYHYMTDKENNWRWTPSNELAPVGSYKGMLNWASSEESAYSVQYAYSSNSLPTSNYSTLKSIYDITPAWVGGLGSPYNTFLPYINQRDKINRIKQNVFMFKFYNTL